ncbi:MAG: glycosyltransferase [Pyrinomonadaceae bacterium]
MALYVCANKQKAGVNCELFGAASPAEAPPLVLAVGRFVQKKAPQITLAAFNEVLRKYPEARLRMIGDGPLLKECQELSKSLAIDGAVTFMGSQPHSVVAKEMRCARLFVQHSIEAARATAKEHHCPFSNWRKRSARRLDISWWYSRCRDRQ